MTFPSLSGPCSDCRTLAPILHSLTALGDFRQGWPKLAPMCDAHRMWPTARQRDADSRWISSRLKGQLSSSSKTQKLFSNGTCWTIKRAASYTFSLQKSSLLPTRPNPFPHSCSRPIPTLFFNCKAAHKQLGPGHSRVTSRMCYPFSWSGIKCANHKDRETPDYQTESCQCDQRVVEASAALCVAIWPMF